MSIVNEKYRGKDYKGAEDWVRSFIDEQVVERHTREVDVKDEEGKPTGEKQVVELKKTSTNLDNLFALARANGIDVDKYEAQRDQRNAPGRLKMTISNMLRAAARKRHGLHDMHGTWVDADADFIGDLPLKENRDGSRIVVAKPEAEPADAEAEA